MESTILLSALILALIVLAYGLTHVFYRIEKKVTRKNAGRYLGKYTKYLECMELLVKWLSDRQGQQLTLTQGEIHTFGHIRLCLLDDKEAIMYTFPRPESDVRDFIEKDPDMSREYWDMRAKETVFFREIDRLLTRPLGYKLKKSSF